MSYNLQWRTPGLNANKAAPIDVPAGAVISDKASLRFTGKGAANYGKVQQENLLRLLESFAGPTPPDFPTVGQLWYDTSTATLRVAADTGSAATPTGAEWRPIGGVTVTDNGTPPSGAAFGDLWFWRTGQGTGLLFIYTGLGRWPAVTWDAYASGYFPAPAGNTLSIKPNYDSFSGVNYGEAYVHGFTGATPADVDGTILVGGVPTPVPRGAVRTIGTGEALLVWDTTATLTPATPGATHFFAVRVLDRGRYQYDNDAAWVDFTPVAGMRAIGTLTVTSPDDVSGAPGGAPGVSSAVAWSSAVELSELVTSSAQRPLGAVGGWEQLFPQVDTIAGREEYDQALDLVQSLIGSPDVQGGAGAIGRSITNLTDFTALDAALAARWEALAPKDPNVLAPVTDPTTELVVEAASRDWDTLLAAARYAVGRLDSSAALVGDVADLPLVQDGRQVDPTLLALASSDPNYPGLVRRSNRRAGAVALVAAWDDTVAALQAAAADRYSLKGVNGTTGAFPGYDATVTQTPHAAFQGTPGSSSVSVALTFRFGSASDARRFFNSGGVLEVSTRHVLPGSPAAQDTNLRNLCNAQGLFRVTADRTRVFPTTGALTMVGAPIAGGAYSVSSVPTTLTTRTSGGVSLGLAAAWSGSTFTLTVTVGAPGSLSGNFGVAFRTAKSNDVYFDGATPYDVYPGPALYNAGDAVTSPASIVYTGTTIVDLPPVANFTASVTSGTTPLAVTFTDTSSGAPTLVEWDFTNNGSIDATGGTANFTYSAAGTYTVRSRATNAAGSDEEIKTDYITVTDPVVPPPNNINLSNDSLSRNIDGSDGSGNSGGVRSIGVGLSNTGVLTIGGAIDPWPSSSSTALTNQWYVGGCTPAVAALYEVRFTAVTGTTGQSDAVKLISPADNQGVWLNLGTSRSSSIGLWIKQSGYSFNNDSLLKVEIRRVSDGVILDEGFYNLHLTSTYNTPCLAPNVYVVNTTTPAGTNTEILNVTGGGPTSTTITRNGSTVSNTLPYSVTLLLPDSGVYSYAASVSNACGSDSVGPFTVTVTPLNFDVLPTFPASITAPLNSTIDMFIASTGGGLQAPIGSVSLVSGSLPPGTVISGTRVQGQYTAIGSYSATFDVFPVAGYTNIVSRQVTRTWTITA